MKQLIAITLLFISSFSFGKDTNLYVSPNGNDQNNGTQSKPFATLAAAKNYISKQQLAQQGNVTVMISQGSYYQSSPLHFDQKDSGTDKYSITFKAHAGQEVKVKGSVPLTSTGWSLYKDGIYRKSLKGTAFEHEKITQLFMNEERMVLARYPNWDYENPLRSGKGYLLCEGGDIDHLQWRSEELNHVQKKWQNPTDGIVHAFHSKNWGNMQYKIKSIDFENNKIMFGEGGWQCQRRVGPGAARGTYSPYYIENIFEELDADYEWYQDQRTQTLYFKTPKGVSPSEVLIEAAATTHIVACVGAKNIHFEGITFTQSHTTYLNPARYTDLYRGDWAISRDGAIYFLNSENCSVKNSYIHQVGSNGVFVDGKNKSISVQDCLIENLGESGVCFVGDTIAVREYQTWENPKKGEDFTDFAIGPKTDDYPKECTVSNCIIRDVGVYGKQTSGVLVSMSMDITISHCSIYRIPRAAVTFNDGSWGGHILEHCDIWDAITETGEHGPFNSWGRERFWHYKSPGQGTKFKKEYVYHDAIKAVHLRNNRVGNYRTGISAGNWTIDLDDGSSNFRIYNNLMLGSTLKLRDGYYRKVYNNIIVSAVPLGFHKWPMDNSEDEFTKNIIVVGGNFHHHGEINRDQSMVRTVRLPKDLKMWGTFNQNLWYNGNTDEKNITSKITFDKWQEKQGKESLFGKPLFEDPANFNYKVKSNSPALKLGFQNFPMDQFGHQMTTIRVGEKEFTKNKTIKITADARGGEVRYTLDGSAPTTTSKLYKSPITVDATTTIRALTFDKQGNAIGFEDKVEVRKVKNIVHQSWLANLLGEEKKSDIENLVKEKDSFEWKGMTLVTISDFPDYIDASGGQNYGVFIESIDKSSNAAKYGFKTGDTIIKFKSDKVEDLSFFRTALNSIGKKENTLSCTIFRNYELIDVNVPMH